jgi:heat-inducible transcriptional repressor
MGQFEMDLTERQQSLLALIVRAYTETAKPIGSKKLLDRYNLNISSATVRNEMAMLTDAGYLRQPHTSAGRVPTEAGYRYFVRGLLGDPELPNAEKRLISHQFHQAHADIDEWVRLSASVLAQHSHVAALVTTPRPERAIFKHLKLIATQGQQVLLVLVLQGGDVRQQILTSLNQSIKLSLKRSHLRSPRPATARTQSSCLNASTISADWLEISPAW